MDQEILTSLHEAVKALRSGLANGRKVKMDRREIKKARKSLDLTQEQFADKVGVSVATVRAWEQGDRIPGALSLALLGAMLSETKKLERA